MVLGAKIQSGSPLLELEFPHEIINTCINVNNKPRIYRDSHAKCR